MSKVIKENIVVEVGRAMPDSLRKKYYEGIRDNLCELKKKKKRMPDSVKELFSIVSDKLKNMETYTPPEYRFPIPKKFVHFIMSVIDERPEDYPPIDKEEFGVVYEQCNGNENHRMFRDNVEQGVSNLSDENLMSAFFTDNAEVSDHLSDKLMLIREYARRYPEAFPRRVFCRLTRCVNVKKVLCNYYSDGTIEDHLHNIGFYRSC